MPVNAKRWTTPLVATLFISSLSMTVMASEYRCGWLENPTADNFWLNDKDGNWTITSQDGYSVGADSIDKLPEVNDDEYVKTNGYYGYSCGCLSVTTDQNLKRIISVDTKGKQELLKTCLENRDLTPKKVVLNQPPVATAAASAPAVTVNTAAPVAAAPAPVVAQPVAVPVEQQPHMIQIFSSYDVNKANRLQRVLNQNTFPILVQPGEYKGRPIYRVRVGPFPTKQAAIAKQNAIKRMFKDNQSIQSSIVIRVGGW
ncbi:DUF4087 domain-containing protein [Leucothrix mucor]|uniref:DUF4087 domain-containing protein n=1 Tax=Leucothrix mucor TaxID=45248 RepID=UPI0003B62732|nr:DUF4087 domain-containing protein [Leucothrix mucor]